MKLSCVLLAASAAAASSTLLRGDSASPQQIVGCAACGVACSSSEPPPPCPPRPNPHPNPLPSPRSLTQDCYNARGGPFNIRFSSLTLTPDPPVPGKAAAWIANSTAGPTAAVSAGSGNIYALLDGVPVYTSPPVAACGASVVTLPLGMGVMHITSLSCPVAANTAASVSVALTLGTGVPKGDFAVILKVDKPSPLYCINATFKIA